MKKLIVLMIVSAVIAACAGEGMYHGKATAPGQVKKETGVNYKAAH